jgi:hypothetical protein
MGGANDTFSLLGECTHGNFATPTRFKRTYSSPELGLMNKWELWTDGKTTAVITVRGTVPEPDSWLVNFYAAMVPAKGTIVLPGADTVNYQVADHQYDYSDVFSVSEKISYASWFNYVTVSNGIDAITQNNDSLEVEMNSDNISAIVRAYPEPMRDMQLVHSGDNNTSIIKYGLKYRTVEQLIEFKDGKGNTQYNIQNIINTRWQHSNLGTLSFIGNQLTASTNGYSLLNIQYSVASIDFLVSDTNIEKIQFILME